MQTTNPNWSTSAFQQMPFLSQGYQPMIQQEYYVGINGKTVADNYPIAPGSTIWLVDTFTKKVYVKTRDFQGNMFPMKEYELVEVESSEETTENSEIDALKKEIEELTSTVSAMKPIIEELKA